jgi:purine-binding chemotaxis protein CheW
MNCKSNEKSKTLFTKEPERVWGKTRTTIRGGMKLDLSFASMLRNVELLAVLVDLYGDITTCNEYLLKHIGWKRKEIIGKNWFEILVPSCSRERLRLLYFQNILLGAFPPQLSYEIHNPQGKQHLISWTNAFLRDGRGRITGLFCIGTEVNLESAGQGEKETSEPFRKRSLSEVALPNSHEEGQNPTCLGIDSKSSVSNMTKNLELEVGGEDSEKEPTSRGGKYLSFFLDREEFGIEIEKVKEIMGVVPIRPLPKAPAYIKGVINLRGQMIPIVELRLKFGMEKVDYTPKTCIVILEIGKTTGSSRIGIIVDTVLEVLNIKEDEIVDAPPFGGGIEAEYIRGLAKSNGKIKILLNMEEVLHSEILLAPARREVFANLSDSIKSRN